MGSDAKHSASMRILFKSEQRRTNITSMRMHGRLSVLVEEGFPMAPMQPAVLPLLFLLLLSSSPPRAHGFQLGQWAILRSLSHSLMARVANARAARGDIAGAERARGIANNLRLLGDGPKAVWSLGWDFARNYAWRGGIPTGEISRAVADLLATLGEAARLGSGAEQAAWALRNYTRLLGRADSLFRGLLRAFSQPGPLRDAVLVIQREVVEGELLRDCLELGANDLEGLLRIASDLFSSPGAYSDRDL